MRNPRAIVLSRTSGNCATLESSSSSVCMTSNCSHVPGGIPAADGCDQCPVGRRPWSCSARTHSIGHVEHHSNTDDLQQSNSGVCPCWSSGRNMISWLSAHEPLFAQPDGQMIRLQDTPRPEHRFQRGPTFGNGLHRFNLTSMKFHLRSPCQRGRQPINNWRRLLLASRSPNNGDVQRGPTLSADCCGDGCSCNLWSNPGGQIPHDTFCISSLCDSWAPSATSTSLFVSQNLWVLMDSLRTRRIRHILRISQMNHCHSWGHLSRRPPQLGKLWARLPELWL